MSVTTAERAAPASLSLPPPRRRRRLLAALVAVGGLAWVIAVWLLLASAAADARAGQALLRRARADLSVDGLLGGGALEDLEAVGDHFRAARRHTSNPLLAPVKVLPYVGRQVTSASALAEAGDEIAAAAVGALAEARAALAEGGGDGGRRLRMLARVDGALADMAAVVERVDLGPDEALLPPLAEARSTLEQHLAQVGDLVARGRTATTGLRQLLAGPRRYLVLAANNAEMQAGWGMPLEAAVLTSDAGALALGERRLGEELMLPEGAAIGDADFARNWGIYEPNREWRNLALTPRFDAAAPLAARMWEAAGGDPVDGVLALDPLVVRALLRGTGPHDAGGRGVEPDSVVELLLHEQYLAFEPGSEGRRERKDLLGDVMAEAVARLNGRLTHPVELVEELAAVAPQRHLLAWSKHPAEQAAWAAMGVDGTLSEDSLLVAVVNRGANKLDWFVSVDAELRTAATSGGREATLLVRVHNRTPRGEPENVAGPRPRLGTDAPGDYLGFVSVNLPGTASGGRRTDGGLLDAAGPDGPTRLLVVPVAVPRGETAEVELAFELPAAQEQIRLEPSARPRAVRWVIDGRRHDDAGAAVPLGTFPGG